MRRRVSVRTGPLSLNTLETVATETAASRATSLIVALIRELPPLQRKPTRPTPQVLSLNGSLRWIADVTVYICGYRRTRDTGLSGACNRNVRRASARAGRQPPGDVHARRLETVDGGWARLPAGGL